MAENKYINKVELGNETLVDLTGDTATASDVLEGVTFHDASGAPVTGALSLDGYQTKTGDTKDNVATFTQASTRANIASGEKLSVLFGKAMKFFADLKTVAFSGSYNDLSNKPVDATQSASGLMSSTDKTKLDGIAEGATANAGTVTGIKMNGASKGTSGVVDLGTVLTAHQDISGKLNTTGDASNTTAAFSTAATRANISTGEKLSVIFGKIAKYFSDLGTWAFKSSGSGSDVGLGNVANLDQSKAIKSITRSGTTFTATALDGTTSTFTQQDNNTWNANAVNTAGYVSAPTSSNANKVWKTDASGNPGWRTAETGSGAPVSMVAEAWNGSTTYAAGSYCTYNNKMWKCLVQNINTTPSEGTYWTEVSCGNELTELNSNLTADGMLFRFGKDADGNYGYILPDGEGGADTVHPFSSMQLDELWRLPVGSGSQNTVTVVCDYSKYEYLLALVGWGTNIGTDYIHLPPSQIHLLCWVPLIPNVSSLIPCSYGNSYNRRITWQSDRILFTTSNPSGNGGNYGAPYIIYGAKSAKPLFDDIGLG